MKMFPLHLQFAVSLSVILSLASCTPLEDSRVLSDPGCQAGALTLLMARLAPANTPAVSSGSQVPYALPVSGAKLWLIAEYGVVDNGVTMVWSDQSGGGYHAVAVDTTRPTLQNQALNGHSILTFNGAQYLTTGSLGTLAQPNTIFVVARAAAGAVTYTFVDGGAVGRHVVNHLNTGQYSMYSGTNLNGPNTPATTYRVLYALFNGGGSVLGIDGFGDFAGNAGAASLSTVHIGADTSLAFGLVGDIAEVIVYNSSISGANRTAVTNYLKNRYGI